MLKGKEKINTPGIFIKVEWYNAIELLEPDERSSIFTNCFKFELDLPFEPMSRTAEVFFISTIIPTLKYNKEKYLSKIEQNIENGSKGGRPPGNKKNRVEPTGFLNNHKENIIDNHIDNSNIKSTENKNEELDLELKSNENQKHYSEPKLNNLDSNENRAHYSRLFLLLITSSDNCILDLNVDQVLFKNCCFELFKQFNFEGTMDIIFNSNDTQSSLIISQYDSKIEFVKNNYVKLLPEIIIQKN
jgi:hypothetical protein